VFGVLQVVSEHFLGEPHKFWSFQKLPWRKEQQFLDDIAYQKQKQEARQQEKKARSISRMRFPSFTGKNPNTWIFMAHKFFEYHQIPNRDRIHVAEFHMKEEAQYWFYNTVHGGLFYDWESFVRELQHRFRKELQEELEADRRLREADQRLHQELPDFDGYKVSAWIHKANQVFNYHRSPMYARVYLASFHMKGEALLWFKNAGQSSGGWEEFLDALQARFPQEWQQQENFRLSQIAKTIAEIQKFCQESRERWGKFSQKRPEEIYWPLKEKEKVEDFELVHMKIESVEFEKIHPVVEKIDTQEEEAKNNDAIVMNFKNPSLISKNAEISVNHQMIDEIPKPNQKVLDTLKGVDEQIEDSFNHLGHHDAHNNDAIAMIPVIESRELQRRHLALRISESVEVEIIALMWKNLGGAEHLTLLMKTLPMIAVNYSTGNCANVLVFKHRWRWKFSGKLPSSIIVSRMSVWVRE
jgi:hypothetical protein